MTQAVSQRIEDLRSVLETTEQHSVSQLTKVAKDLKKWETQVHSSLPVIVGVHSYMYNREV